jgi:excinuclease UvrABC nuclease subunit
MQWDPHDVVDSRIVDASEWWINLKDFETLEKRAGVYLFANSKYHIKYVGTAGANGMIDKIRDAISKKRCTGSTQVRALYTNSNKRAHSLEKYLIEKYNPVKNRK